MFSVQLCITRYLAVVFCSRLYRLYRASAVLLMNMEWSRQELCKLKQGFMRIKDFMNKFISLKQQGNVSDDFACALLEQALRPELLHEVLLTNCDLSD